jgi:hypothetical protein
MPLVTGRAAFGAQSCQTNILMPVCGLGAVKPTIPRKAAASLVRRVVGEQAPNYRKALVLSAAELVGPFVRRSPSPRAKRIARPLAHAIASRLSLRIDSFARREFGKWRRRGDPQCGQA